MVLSFCGSSPVATQPRSAILLPLGGGKMKDPGDKVGCHHTETVQAPSLVHVCMCMPNV